MLSVRALLARLWKRNKRKVVSDSRVTLPGNFACKPGLSFNLLVRVALAVALAYLLVNRDLVSIPVFRAASFTDLHASVASVTTFDMERLCTWSLVRLCTYHHSYVALELNFSFSCMLI